MRIVKEILYVSFARVMKKSRDAAAMVDSRGITADIPMITSRLLRALLHFHPRPQQSQIQFLHSWAMTKTMSFHWEFARETVTMMTIARYVFGNKKCLLAKSYYFCFYLASARMLFSNTLFSPFCV